MVQISASLLAADYARLGEEVIRAEKAGVDSFHFDLMDGHYAPNIALAPQHLRALRGYTQHKFIAHLELSNPDEVIEHFEALDADAIVVMIDTLPNPRRTFANIRAQDKQVGLSLKPGETIEAVEQFFPDIDLLIILGVNPGFGGQEMQINTLQKIARVRTILEKESLDVSVVVDGGVKVENASQLIKAGADTLIIGSALFQCQNMRSFVAGIKDAVVG